MEFTKYELEVLIGIFGYTKEEVLYFRKASEDTEKWIERINKKYETTEGQSKDEQ